MIIASKIKLDINSKVNQIWDWRIESIIHQSMIIIRESNAEEYYTYWLDIIQATEDEVADNWFDVFKDFKFFYEICTD
jgi:hypothetical protein